MKAELKNNFINSWNKYFANTELPIVFFYSDENKGAEYAEKPEGWNCVIRELVKVRNGKSLAFNIDSLTCGGSKRYMNFTDKMRPGFEYFLSCGNENMHGEKYIKTPEMVKEILENQPKIIYDNKKIVFKRWDNISETDDPEVVIFFAKPDVLSGLFTLANFDQTDPNGSITPFGAGCASVVYFPYLESKSEKQRAVIGMFDITARPFVPANVITFAIPFKRFEKMVGYMEESFLTTNSWNKLKSRIEKD